MSYMDPYIQNVLNRNESLAGRTLQEKFLPSLQRSFTGAGQFGSRGGFGSMEDIGVRGVRDITEGLNEQNLAALSGAYGQAGELFGADRARDIQAGEIRGGLEEAGGRLDVQQGLGMLQAGEPYIPYGGPRIMPFSPEEEAGFGLAEENVGAYQPYLEAGAEGVRGGLDKFAQDYDPRGVADPYLESGTQNFPGAVDDYMDPYIQNVRPARDSLRLSTF